MVAEAEMLATLEGMVELNPGDAGAWSMLGLLLRRAGRLDEAIASHSRALEHDSGNAAIWTNLGNALVDSGRFDEALVAHTRALCLEPHGSTFLFNAVVALRKAGRFREALITIDRASAVEQPSTVMRWERALTRLQIGDYVHGFGDYEARRGLPALGDRQIPGPLWDGGPLDGRTILLSTEQGFGDALLTARYIPLVRAHGGRVLYECHPELRRVLAGLEVDEFLTPGAPVPPYDVHASQMSLPGLFGTTLASIPPPVRLAIPDDSRAKAARHIGPPEPGILRVGIVWAGRETFADNARRATTLARFLGLAEVPGVRLYSLQKGPRESELEEPGRRTLVTRLGPHLDDFADTAAMLERLDLVIMTDSAVAHLAGSLGRPVWNLVQHVPYWIYGVSGPHTPWYPTMRLFRQGSSQEWGPVFSAVKEQLRALRR